MKSKYIRIASDLHLEGFAERTNQQLHDQFVPADDRDAESILVLAGDISSKLPQLVSFLESLAPRFNEIIFVPGNHEFYKHDISEWAINLTNSLSLLAIQNIHVATHDVECSVLSGTRFVYCTLWADGGNSLYERAEIGRSLRDFYVIKFGPGRWKVSDMCELHKTQKAKLDLLLKVPFDGKTVVVTHHMPSYRLCHPRFGSDINGGFASNCEDILAYDHAPDIWVNGHTHDTYDTMLWKTRVICNPAGYFSETGSSQYNSFAPKFVEL